MSMSTKTYYKMLVALGIMMMAGLVLAAPQNTPMNEDLLGSRIYYRNRENEDNMIPTLGFDQRVPVMYDPHVPQQSENALLNYLLGARRLGINRLRSYVDSNEISRKRSYSKFCAFNAVSCFGK